MYHSKLVSVLLIISFVLNFCTGATIYPKSLQTLKSSASTVPMSALQTQDQSGSQDSWNKYVEFYGTSTAYQGVFTFDASSITTSSVASYSVVVNFRGDTPSSQTWTFELYNPSTSSWTSVGDNTGASSSWKWKLLTFAGTVDYATLAATGTIQVRMTSTVGDDCDLDYFAISTVSGSAPTVIPVAPTTRPAPTVTPTPATDAPTFAPTVAATVAPTVAATVAPTVAATVAPTVAATVAPTVAATVAPTHAATVAPTHAATVAPTPAPTAASTVAPTTVPTITPPAGRVCAAGEVWAPAPGTTWQWQLTGAVDISLDVQMYDIDLFDNTAATIRAIHANGSAVICYFSTQYENWRSDSAMWPASILGANLDDWPGEKYADIRSPILRSIMQSRLDLAVSKGCDGVEPDNVDEYANTNGLGITAADQTAFNVWMASEAHKRGLSVGLKNDLGQAKALQPNYDWALNEQCNQYSECADLSAFVTAGKAVFGVEYSGTADKFCPTMVKDKFSWLKKTLDLDSTGTQCCSYITPGGCTVKPAHQCINYNTAKRSEIVESETVTAVAEIATPFDSAATFVSFPIVAFVLVAIALVL